MIQMNLPLLRSTAGNLLERRDRHRLSAVSPAENTKESIGLDPLKSWHILGIMFKY